MSDRDHDRLDEVNANPGYALGQLARALSTSQEHEDPETRRRARLKADNWVKVFQGMLSGALQVGSRTPLRDMPNWATLEVAQGGFATGELLAGGVLKGHEAGLLRTLPAHYDELMVESERAALNSYFLSDDGRKQLGEMLSSGNYRIEVAEEGALLVVAWLLQHGQAEQAQSILDAIAPYMSRLRFYPVINDSPLPSGSEVHLEEVGQTVGNLRKIKPRPQALKEQESVLVFNPIYDQVVQLFVETVEDGWPCQVYPEGWQVRGKQLLQQYEAERRNHRLTAKPDNRKHNFAILRGILKECLLDPRRLTGRQVGMVRIILNDIERKRGLPQSPAFRSVRQAQKLLVERAMARHRVKDVLVERLLQEPQNDGLTASSAPLYPITAEEAERFGLPGGLEIPANLQEKVKRCLNAPVQTLVENGLISSGEVLAKVIPQITSQIRALGIADLPLRRLYSAIYSAFRRRRSLLLLNLEHQVQLTELPWVQAIEGQRQADLNAQVQARQTLEEVVSLAITAFPQQILPNKLLQEVRALAKGAGLELPIVDEVAADIFMGEFTGKFLQAAKKAGALLEGSLYERYYGLSYAEVRALQDVPKQRQRWSAPVSEGFAQICRKLAGSNGSSRYSVAANGKVIEQEQILTTHNLAVLFQELGLTESLRTQLDVLAQRNFHWIVRRQQQKSDDWKAQLQMLKNTAYAWRQMVFFLALTSKESVSDFLQRAFEHLSQQRDADYIARFRPVLDGLALANEGYGLEDTATSKPRFLGWTTERHFLLPPKAEPLSTRASAHYTFGEEDDEEENWD